MFGREQLLDALLQRVRDGAVEHSRSSRVQVLLLRGEAGVGKTRLLAELARRMSDGDARVLAGWCDAEGVVPFRPLMEAFRQVVDEGGAAWPSSVAKAAAFVARYLTDAADARQRTDPEADRLRFFESMANLLHELARHGPLVLAIDDIHWLDPSSAALLRYLLRQPVPHPVVVAACYRSDPTEHTSAWARTLEELQRQPDSSPVDVTDLTAEASARLIAEVTAEVGLQDADALAHRILPITGGNPLFVREVVTQLSVSGNLEDGGDSVPVPSTMLATVAHRLQSLSATAQGVVNAAAVVGREFALEDVAAVTHYSADTVLAALDEARSLRLVDEVPGRFDGFAFRHAAARRDCTSPPARRGRIATTSAPCWRGPFTCSRRCRSAQRRRRPGRRSTPPTRRWASWRSRRLPACSPARSAWPSRTPGSARRRGSTC
jgi:predicted ATPase